MNNRIQMQLGFAWLILLLLAGSAQATCYSTPRLAIDSVLAGSPPPALKNGGYRVVSIQSDPTLGQRWAMVANCVHPEWPVFALPAGEASPFKASQPEERSQIMSARPVLVIHAGDIVQLWRQESFSRIEVVGVSEESGELGKTIRVRLLHPNTEDQSVSREFSGVVRGPSDVEMQP
jgi:hypothetical protein